MEDPAPYIPRTPPSTEPHPWATYPECPECRSNTWQLGPRGGLAVNLKCLGCGRWFNAPMMGWIIHRIGGPDDHQPPQS